MNLEENRNKRAKTKKKWSTKKKVLVSTSIVFFLIIATLLGGYFYIKSKIYVGGGISAPKGDREYTEVKGITNVLLIGIDARELTESSRSDSIMIATLDNNNKVVKLTSLFRDTLVDIPGYGESKINAAYALGGADLLLQTIRDTYDISIDKYIVINFWGFEAIIDQIDGIEVDVKDYQLEELNKYIGESTGGNDCPVSKAGLQTLNGKQALSYARIRYNVGDEYERTERQREVIFKVVEKLKVTSPTKYFGIMNKMLDYILTNIDPLDALNMAYTIYKFPSLDMEQLQLPVTELAEGRLYKNLGWVFLMDVEQNTKILHDFIFNNVLPDSEDYDFDSFNEKMNDYASQEGYYNNINGINPEDYDNDENDSLPEKLPEVVIPETTPETTPEVTPEEKPEVKPEPEEPEVKPEEPEVKPEEPEVKPDEGQGEETDPSVTTNTP